MILPYSSSLPVPPTSGICPYTYTWLPQGNCTDPALGGFCAMTQWATGSVWLASTWCGWSPASTRHVACFMKWADGASFPFPQSSLSFWLATLYCCSPVPKWERVLLFHNGERKQVHEHLSRLGGCPSLSAVPGFCCCLLHSPLPTEAQRHMVFPSPLQHLPRRMPGGLFSPGVGMPAPHWDQGWISQGTPGGRLLGSASAGSQLRLLTVPSASQARWRPVSVTGFGPGQEGGTTQGKPTNAAGKPNLDFLTYSVSIYHHKVKRLTTASMLCMLPCARKALCQELENRILSKPRKPVRPVSQAVHGTSELRSASPSAGTLF